MLFMIVAPVVVNPDTDSKKASGTLSMEPVKIIGSIPKDTIVSYYSGGEGSWGIVYYNGKYGYVNTAYISTELYTSND